MPHCPFCAESSSSDLDSCRYCRESLRPHSAHTLLAEPEFAQAEAVTPLERLFAAYTSGADLRGACLAGADLFGIHLAAADLRGADLSDSNLSGADLSGADLRDAYLRRADLSDSNLSGADLGGALLDDAELEGARFDGFTVWPEGVDPLVEGARQLPILSLHP